MPRPPTGRCRARAALVELQRENHRADPGARNADRHAPLEPGAGVQGGSRPSVDASGSIRATAANTRSTARRASGTMSASSVACELIGVAWPRKESGRLDLEGDTFKLMYHVPGIERLHALRDSLGVIVEAVSDRPRRTQPPEPLSVLHRHRPQRASQQPVQRPCRRAVLHGLSRGRDGRLFRLAHARDRDRRRVFRRPGTNRCLSGW